MRHPDDMKERRKLNRNVIYHDTREKNIGITKLGKSIASQWKSAMTQGKKNQT
jgi:hypothetical protein